MDCRGALNVAISNPDPNQVDILCPVYGDTCYSPQICHGFNEVPFFNICEVSRSSDCKLNICFGNVSEVLNNTRLDFFVSEKVICDINVYNARTYIRSFEIEGNFLHQSFNNINVIAFISIKSSLSKPNFWRNLLLSRTSNLQTYLLDMVQCLHIRHQWRCNIWEWKHFRVIVCNC